MKKLMLTLALFTSSLSAMAQEAQCEQNSQLLGARYEITRRAHGQQLTETSHFNLWRRANQVAHEDLSKQITDVWELVYTGKTKPTRYFDEYQRAIEYQPSDLNRGKGDTHWQMKYQLVESELFEQMSKLSESGSGCERVVIYTNDEGVQLHWLPALNLVKKYQETNAQGMVSWNLIALETQPQQINQVYASRERYQSTDYIDIGDNESDPFLMKLINLGFVEHGASGFYDAQGHALDGASGHHGHQH